MFIATLLFFIAIVILLTTKSLKVTAVPTRFEREVWMDGDSSCCNLQLHHQMPFNPTHWTFKVEMKHWHSLYTSMGCALLAKQVDTIWFCSKSMWSPTFIIASVIKLYHSGIHKNVMFYDLKPITFQTYNWICFCSLYFLSLGLGWMDAGYMCAITRS